MQPLLADVTFTSEGLAVMSVLMGALAGAIAMLWKEQRRSDGDRISDLERQRDSLLRVLYRLDLADQVPPEVPHGALPPPPPPPRSR